MKKVIAGQNARDVASKNAFMHQLLQGMPL